MECVLLTQRVEVVKEYNERRDCVDQRICDFVYDCGYIPIPVPNKKDIVETIFNYLNPIGIILTGGNSLVKYGGNAPERDEVDHLLIEISIKNNIPLYGFCRGMQSILNYFGNDLEQVMGHVAKRHQVYDGKVKYEVNSYHNQGCKKINLECGLIVESRAEDGVIESIMHNKYRIEGTMWHPEREEIWKQNDIDRVRRLFTRGK